MRICASILCSMLLFFCSSEPNGLNPGSERNLELRLVRSFGGDDVEKDYLLVQPSGIAVDDFGNIYVADEKRIKVFSENGDEITQIGRPGQGPGEFVYAGVPTVGPQGHLTAANGRLFNLYRPDNTFARLLRHIGYDEPSATIGCPPKVVAFSEDEFIGDATTFLRFDRGLRIVRRTLYQYAGGGRRELVSYQAVTGHRTMAFTYGGEGAFHWQLLPGRRVIYTDTGSDLQTANGESWYELHVLSIDAGEHTVMRHPYRPVRIPESELSFFQARRNTSDSYERIWEFIRDNPFYSPIYSLLADVDLIFAFTNETTPDGEYIVDIFDAAAGEYVRTVEFPILEHSSNIPQVIRNGRAYRIRQDFATFPEIEIYEFDRGVYIR